MAVGIKPEKLSKPNCAINNSDTAKTARPEDSKLRAIAKTGGVIGIGFWDTAVCGTDATAIARAIHDAANKVGIDHVALGSDFDGSVKAPFDSSGEALITDALIDEGFSDADIAKIMGGNILRLLSENLPD